MGTFTPGRDCCGLSVGEVRLGALKSNLIIRRIDLDQNGARGYVLIVLNVEL